MMRFVRSFPHVNLFWTAAYLVPVVLLGVLLDPAPRLARAQNSQTSQEAVVAPNENLVVENIPPIPQSLADHADRYTNFRSAIFASWHPTKREMLISTRFADTFQIHQVKMPGGARTQLTFYVDDVRSALYPPQGGDSFVFSKDIGGGEFYQLYRYDEASGAVTLLTDGKSRNTAKSGRTTARNWPTARLVVTARTWTSG